MAKATGRKAPVAKKAVPVKVAAKRAAVTKKAAPAAKKVVAKKAVAKIAPKAPAKVVAKKTMARKTMAKPAPAKAGAKATSAKKSAPVKVAAKKAAPVKASPVKASPSKTNPVKTNPVKATPAKKAAPAKAPTKAVVKVAVKPVPVKKQPAGRTCALSGLFVPKQSPNITPKTMERLREILDEERARHVRQAEDLQADADALVDQREQGDTQFDEESGEGDTISVERERDLMMSATARLAVEEIDHALERIVDGSYGLCSPAGRRIPVARLEAIPWADTCVDCKQRVERRR